MKRSIKASLISVIKAEIYLYVDPSLVPLAGNIAAWPETLRHAAGWASLARKGQSDMRARFETLPDGSRLLLALPIEIELFTARIAVALALALLLIFVLAAAASILVTRRTVGRIEAINATSREIMRSGLGQRIPLRGTGDEWDDLAANLNSMLDRIETLVTQVKQVTDNVAHDLRTPLTRMRNRLEKAYYRTRDGDCVQAVIGDALADIDSVLTMFSSLMRISRIEASDRAAGFRSVDLARIAHEVAELFDAAAEEKGDHITASGDQHVLVEGDRDLLFDALANLVDNAIKHGCPAGGVTVEVSAIDGAPVISVADRGPGIPAEEFEHVFKHFYRLERSRHTVGNGLGLSLVAAVARLHGVRIEMFDNAPGLGVRLCFPSASTINGERRMPS